MARPEYLETDMLDRILTPLAVCVLAAFPVLLCACAGHTAPPARNGDIEKPGAESGTSAAASALAELTKSSAVPANTRSLPDKLLVGVRLNQTLSTTKPEGFAFSTTVVEPVKTKTGATAVPTTAVLRGVVSAVRAGSATTTPVICVKLDFLEMNGRSYAIRSSVKNVLVNDKPVTILPRDSVNAIFPNEPGGPLKGTAVALTPAAAGEAAELPAGSTFVVELDSALTLVATPAR
jgi:hypothetical protein